MKRSDKDEIDKLIGLYIGGLIRKYGSMDKAQIKECYESMRSIVSYANLHTHHILWFWALVKYATINGISNEKWKNKLFEYLQNLNHIEIKPYNDRQMVEKLLNKQWLDINELDTDESYITHTINDIFNVEKIQLKENELLGLAHELQEKISDVIKTIAHGNKNSISKYVNNI